MYYRSRILWVEALAWSAIALTVFTLIARIFYWQHFRDAEDKLVAWLGISPNVHEILKVVVATLGLAYLLSCYGPFRRRP